jgi:flagellum-specific peptidoglycan hydrolase FlgJ
MTRKEYIQKYKDVVLEVVKGTGLFPSLMMAQAILESSDKNGILVTVV